MNKMMPVVALVILAIFSQARATPSGFVPLDQHILNFALNLEYLEANFYSCAVFGTPLTAAQRGNGPAPLGCMQSAISNNVLPYAKKIAMDEIAHVALIRSFLGSAAQPQPLIDLTQFAPLAATAYKVATNDTLVGNFNYSTNLGFLLSAFIFEDVGVTAYLGAAPLLTSKDVLSYAGSILGTEAYHGGLLRSLLIQNANMTVPGFSFTVAAAANIISNLRNVLSTTEVDDLGITTTNGTYIPVPTDVNGLVYSRSYCQVLNIVYFGNPTSGGFFPNGLNGALKACKS